MLIQRLKEAYKISAGTGAVYLSPERIVFQRADKSRFVVDVPGEYDIAQIYLEYQILKARGKASPSVIVEAEGFSLVYLPGPSSKFAEDSLKAYEHVDILMVPGEAVNLVTQLAPPLVVPLDQPQKMAQFLGVDTIEQKTSLKLKSPRDLPENTEGVGLKVKS